MAATTVERNTKTRHFAIREVVYKVAASTKILAGTLVSSVAGYAAPAADTAATSFLGLAIETVDNTAGAAGALSVRIHSGLAVKVEIGTLVQADVGFNAMAVDNQTVSNAATTTNDIVVGKIEEIDADGDVWVMIA